MSSAKITADDRGDVLLYAAGFTSDRHNPVAVATNAIPLLEWLEEAASEADVRTRIRAMRQQSSSVRSMDAPERCAWHDKPQTFVTAAQVLYDFMTAGDAS